jgi:hypothetical protein
MTSAAARITAIELRLRDLAKLQRQLRASRRRFRAKSWSKVVEARARP